MWYACVLVPLEWVWCTTYVCRQRGHRSPHSVRCRSKGAEGNLPPVEVASNPLAIPMPGRDVHGLGRERRSEPPATRGIRKWRRSRC
jgi:hypothetical protein